MTPNQPSSAPAAADPNSEPKLNSASASAVCSGAMPTRRSRIGLHDELVTRIMKAKKKLTHNNSVAAARPDKNRPSPRGVGAAPGVNPRRVPDDSERPGKTRRKVLAMRSADCPEVTIK